MLVHGQPCRAVAVDRSGNYLATSSTDRTVKVWDLRTYQPVCQYSVGAGAKDPELVPQGAEWEWEWQSARALCIYACTHPR